MLPLPLGGLCVLSANRFGRSQLAIYSSLPGRFSSPPYRHTSAPPLRWGFFLLSHRSTADRKGRPRSIGQAASALPAWPRDGLHHSEKHGARRAALLLRDGAPAGMRHDWRHSSSGDQGAQALSAHFEADALIERGDADRLLHLLKGIQVDLPHPLPTDAIFSAKVSQRGWLLAQPPLG